MTKNILITGCSGGIGYETCKRFYFAKNWIVYGTYTTEKKVKKLKQLMPNNWDFFKCDVTNEKEVREVVSKIPRIDVLVNNAGTKTSGRLEDITSEEYDKVMDVNVKGCFLMMKYVIPKMKTQGGGKIINIASTVGTRECPYLSPYAASKHALVGLSHSVRDECIEDNILVNIIYPGATDTPFQLPGKKGLMNVKEVADSIYFITNRGDNAICDLFIYPKNEKRRP